MGVGTDTYKDFYMKYKVVIFDLDGVICHTDEYHYLAWKQIADEEGIYFDREINQRLRGVSRTDSLEIVLERATKCYSTNEKKALAARKNEIYVKLLGNLNADNMAADVVPTLAKLKAEGVKIAIGSSSKNTKLILQKLGIADMFDAVADGTMVSNSKPHPEVFVKAMDMLMERPCECLIVEDAVAGIEAAYRAGVDSAGIGDAQTHPKVTYKIEKLSDLLEILGITSDDAKSII